MAAFLDHRPQWMKSAEYIKRELGDEIRRYLEFKTENFGNKDAKYLKSANEWKSALRSKALGVVHISNHIQIYKEISEGICPFENLKDYFSACITRDLHEILNQRA